MKKCLYISYSFPPLHIPEAIQAGRFASHLPSCNWTPTVITVDKKYTSDPIDETLYILLKDDLTTERTRSIESTMLSLALFLVMDYTGIIPDVKIFWYHYAVKHIKKLLEHSAYDVIYSRSMYITSHLVAHAIKKATGLPWVAHFSDPWTDSTYYRLGNIRGVINKHLEKTIITEADAIVFVTEATKELVMKKYDKKLTQKATVIPHSYDPELFRQKDHSKNHKVIFTHTGSFYRNRTPESILHALQNVLKNNPDCAHNILFQHVGPFRQTYTNMIKKYHVAEIVEIAGKVSYMKSLEYLDQADVLVIIDAPADGPSVFLPSKLIEYVGSGKPVLALTPENGASADLVRRINGIVVDPRDVEGITAALENIYEEYRQDPTLSKYSYSYERIKEYDVATTTSALAEVLDKVTG